MTNKPMYQSEEEVIHSYTADQAVDDGFLAATTDLVPDEDLAKQAGFTIPVRLTPGVVELVSNLSVPGQDLKGRLWDTLSLAARAVKAQRSTGDGFTLAAFKVLYRQWEAPNGLIEFDLWACLDMTSGPAIHIMRPEEY